MKKSQSIIIILCCLHAFLFNSLLAQTIDKGELMKGSLLIEQIKPGEIHQYSIKLKKDEFSFIKLKQLGTDVIISTFDTERKKIKEYNTLNGNTGPEFVSLTVSLRPPAYCADRSYPVSCALKSICKKNPDFTN